MTTMRLRVIVKGLVGLYPVGGVACDYLQYVLGLARLRHDVYYFEDIGQWPYNPMEGGISKECTYNINYLNEVMSRFGMADKWAYRFPWKSQWFGLKDKERELVIKTSDLLINVSCTLQRPSEYRQIRRLVYVDTDPVFTQIKLARDQADFRKLVDLHDFSFSYGEHLSESGICVLIDTRLSVGCRVNLDLLLPSSSGVCKQKSSNPVNLQGVVIRVKFSELFNKYEVGIKLTDTHLHSKEKIKSFIKKYI